MNGERVAPHLRPKTRQILHHLLRPVRRELIMPLTGNIPRLPALKMRRDIRELVVDVNRVRNGEIEVDREIARRVGSACLDKSREREKGACQNRQYSADIKQSM